jgi:predicted transport protein
LFDDLRSHVLAVDSAVVELAESNSVSYHGPGSAFFLEVLPRRYGLTLLLALDFNQIADPSGLAQDATQKKYFANACNEGGVSIELYKVGATESAIPIIRQAYTDSCE